MSGIRATDPAVSPSQVASNRGALLHFEGDRAGAKRAYEEALELDPENPTALNNYGFLLAEEGRLDEAEALYNRALARNPESSTLRANLGNLRAMRGDVNGAIEHLEAAVSLDPRNALAWDSLGRLLLMWGRPDEAEGVWTAAIRAFSRGGEGEDGEGGEGGGAARAAGDEKWARPGDASEEVFPELSLFLVGLGTALAAQGRREEALAAFRRAVVLDPSSAEAWTQLGIALFVRRDLGSAEEVLRRALALDPENSRARRHLGMVHLALGDRQAARRELEEAARAGGGDVRAAVDLAALDLSEGRPQAALERLEPLTPPEAGRAPGELGERIRFYLGVALDQVGRADEAAALLQPLADQVFGKYAAEARSYLARREGWGRERNGASIGRGDSPGA